MWRWQSDSVFVCLTKRSGQYPYNVKKEKSTKVQNVVKDHIIASKRIHFERIIGLAKKCTILKKELSHDKAMGSRIIFICVSIFNFRHYIVNKYS